MMGGNNFRTILVSTWTVILFLFTNSCVPAAVSKSEKPHTTDSDDLVGSILSSAIKSLGGQTHDESKKLKPKLKYPKAESHYYPPARPYHELPPILPPSRPYPYQNYLPPRLYYFPQPIQRYLLPIELYGQRYPPLIISPAGQLYPPPNLYYVPQSVEATSSPTQYYEPSIVSPAQSSASSQCIFCVVNVQSPQNNLPSKEPRSSQLPSSISDSQSAPAKASILELPSHQSPPSEIGLGPLSQPSQARQSLSSESPSKPVALQSLSSPLGSESTLGKQSYPEQLLREPSLSEAALQSPLHQLAPLGPASLQSFPSQTHLESTKCSTQLSEPSQGTSAFQTASSGSHSLSPPHLSVSSASSPERPHPSSAAILGSEQVSGAELTSKLPPYQRPASETVLQQPSDEPVPLQPTSSQSIPKAGTAQSSVSSSDSESILGKESSPQQPLRQPSLSETVLQSPLHQLAPLGPASLQSFQSQTQPESTKRSTQPSEPSQGTSAFQTASSGSLSAPRHSDTSASPTELKPHSASVAIPGSEQVSCAELASKLLPYQRPASEIVLQQPSHEPIPLQPLSSQSIPKAGTSYSPASTSDSESILGKESSQQQPLRQPSLSEAALQSPLHQLAPLGAASLQSFQSQTHPESTKRSTQLSEPSQGTSALQTASSGSLSVPHHSDISASSTELRPHSPSAAILGSEQVSGAELTSKLPPYQRPASETVLLQPSDEPVPLQPSSSQSPSKAGTSQSSPSTSDSESTLGKESRPQQPLRHPSLSEVALQSALHQSAPLGPASLQSFQSQTHPESTKRSTQLSEPSQGTSALQTASSGSLSAPHHSDTSASPTELKPHSASVAIPGSEQVSGAELASKLLPHQRAASEIVLQQPSHEPIPLQPLSSQSIPKAGTSYSPASTSDSESILGKESSLQQPLRQPSLSEAALQSPLHQLAPLGAASLQSFQSQTHPESTKRSTQLSEPSQGTSALQTASSGSLSVPHHSDISASSTELRPHSPSAAILGSEQVSGAELTSKLPPYQRSASETVLLQPSDEPVPLQPSSSQSPSKAGTSQSSPSTSDSESTLGKESRPQQPLRHPSLSEVALQSALHQSAPLGAASLQSFQSQTHPESTKRSTQLSEPSQGTSALQTASSGSLSVPHHSDISASSTELKPHSASVAIPGSEQVSGAELASKLLPHQRPASEIVLQQPSHEPIPLQPLSSQSIPKAGTSYSPASTSDSESILGKESSQQQPLRQPSWSKAALQSPLHQLAPLGPQSFPSQNHPEATERQIKPLEPSQEKSTLQSPSSESHSQSAPYQSVSSVSSAELRPQSSSAATPGSEQLLSKELTSNLPPYQRPASETALEQETSQLLLPQLLPASSARQTTLSQPSREPISSQPSLSGSPSKTGTSQSSPSTSDSESTLGKQSRPQQPVRHPSLSEAALDSSLHQSAPLGPRSHQSFPSQTRPESTKRSILLSEPFQETSTLQSELSKPQSLSAPHQSVSSASSAELRPLSSSAAIPGSEQVSGAELTSKLPPYQRPASEIALERETPQILLTQLPPGSLAHQTPLSLSSQELVVREESSPESSPNTAAYQSSPSMSNSESALGKGPSSQPSMRQASLSEVALQSPLHQSAPLGPLQSFPPQTHPESTKRSILLSEPSQETSTLQSELSKPQSLSAPHQSVSSAPSAELRPHSSSAAIPGSEQASGAELTSKLPPYQRPASEIALKRETRQILLTQLPPGSLAHQTPLSLSSQELVIREESSPESSPNTAAYQSSPSMSNSESALGKKPSPQQSMRQPSLSEVALQSPLHQSAPLGPLQSFPSQTHPESTKRSILLPEPSQETSALQSVSSAELRPHLSLAAIPGSEQLSGEELTSKLLPYQRPASETALEQETPQHFPSQLPLGSSAHQTPLSKPSQELLIHKESSPDSSSNTAAYVSSPSMSDTESTLGEEPSPQQSMRQPSSSETALNSPLHQSAELGLASLQSFPSQTHLESTKRSTQLTEASQETSTLQSTSSKPHSLSAPHQSVSSGSFAEVRPHPSSAAVPGYEQVSGKELTSKLSPYQRPASETASERETPQISLPQLLPGSSARQTSLSQPSEELVVHKEFSPESSSNTAAYQSSPSMSSAESTLGKQPSPQQSLRQPSLPQALQSPLHHSAELGLASLQSFPSQTHPESTKRPSQLSELSQEKSALQSLSSGSHSLSAPHLSVTSASSTELKPHSSSAAILGSEQVSDAELTSKMPPYQRPASETVLQQQSHERVPLQPLSSQSIPKAGTPQSSASTSDSGSILGKESSQQQPLRQPSWSETALQSPLHQLAPLGPASLQSSQSQTHPESTKRSIQLSEPSQGTSALQIASSGSLSAPHHSDTSASSTELRQHSPSAAIIGSEQVSGAELTSKLPPYQRPASETALQQPSHEPVPLQPPSSAAIPGSEHVSGEELISKLPPFQRPASETALEQKTRRLHLSQLPPESSARQTSSSQPSHKSGPLQPLSSQSPSKAGTSQSSPSTSDSESTLGKQSSPQHHPSLSEAALDSSLHQSVPLGPRPLQSFSLQNHPERQIQPLEPSQEKLTLQSPSSESHSQSAPYQSVSSASSKERTPYSSSAAIPVAEQVSGEELTSRLLPYQRPALENGLEPETQQLLLPRLPPGSSARQTSLSEVTKEPITPKSPSSKSPSKTVASQSSPSTSESESTLGKYPSPQQPVRQLSLSETALESPLHQSAPLGPASPHSFPSQTHLESTERSTRQSEPSQETSRLQSASSNSLARSAPHQSVSSASSKEHIPHSSSAAIPGSEHVSGEELISKLPPFQRPASETALEQKTRRLHLSQLPPESSARQTSSSQPSHKSGPLQPLSSQSPSKAGTSQSSPSTSDSESTLGKQSSPHHHPSLSEAALDSSLHQSVPLGPRPLQSFSLQNHPERQIQPLEPSQEKLTLQSPSSESHSQSSPHQSVSSVSSVELRPHSSSAAILGSEQVSGEELTSKQPPYQKPASETALERETPQLFPTQLSPGSSARQTPVSHVSKEPITPKSPSSESPSKTVASQSSPSTSESESTLGKYPPPQQPLRQSSLSETALQSPLHQSAPLGPGSLQSVQSQSHPESTKRSTQLSESPREYLTLQPASSESRSLSAPHQSGSSTSSTELTPHSPSAATPDSEQVFGKAEILQPPPHQRPQSKTPLAQGARNLLLPEPPSGLSVSQKSPSHKPVPLQSSSSQSASKTGTSQPAPSTSDSELILGKQSAPQQPLRVLSLPETALESLPRQSAPVKTQLSEPSPESISSKSYSQSAPHQSASSASSATLTPHQSSSLSLGLESTSDIAPTSKPPLYQNPSSETALEQETQPKPPQTPLPGESSPGQAPLFTRLVATESTTDKVSSSEQTPRQALLKEPESESILHQSTLLATAAAQGSLPSQSHLESTTQETLQSEPSQETQTRRPTSKHPLPVSAEYEEPSLRQSPTKSVTRLSAQSTSAPELTTRQPATSEPSLNLKKTPSGVGPTKSPLPSSKKSSKGTTPPPKKKKKRAMKQVLDHPLVKCIGLVSNKKF